MGRKSRLEYTLTVIDLKIKANVSTNHNIDIWDAIFLICTDYDWWELKNSYDMHVPFFQHNYDIDQLEVNAFTVHITPLYWPYGLLWRLAYTFSPVHED